MSSPVLSTICQESSNGEKRFTQASKFNRPATGGILIVKHSYIGTEQQFFVLHQKLGEADISWCVLLCDLLCQPAWML